MAERESTTWSPLRLSLFRALWLAAVASNVGTWMHNVGAEWLMTTLAPTPFVVALVQTAEPAPAPPLLASLDALRGGRARGHDARGAGEPVGAAPAHLRARPGRGDERAR